MAKEILMEGKGLSRVTSGDAMQKVLDEDEEEIARVMDGMLDFCWFDEMLLLSKRLCRGLYPQHPQLVQDYISYYREMWDEE